jgi:hypothetical protein
VRYRLALNENQNQMTARGVDNVTNENYWSGIDDTGTYLFAANRVRSRFRSATNFKAKPRSGQGGSFPAGCARLSVKRCPFIKHTGDRRERRVNVVGCRRGKRPDASSRFTEPTYSTYRPWRRHRYRPVSRHRSGDSNGGPGGTARLCRRRDRRLSDHAPAGRNGRRRAGSGSFAHFAYKYWGPFAGFLPAGTTG